jgi:hypothetical protein
MQELNISNSDFRPNEELSVKLTGQDLAVLDFSIESMFNNNIQSVRPLKFRYFDKNDELIINPTLKQIEDKDTVKVFDQLAFMSANNVVDAYVGDLSPLVMKAQEVIGKFREQGIDQGKAVLIEDLIKEQEELNKSKLQVVKDE